MSRALITNELFRAAVHNGYVLQYLKNKGSYWALKKNHQIGTAVMEKMKFQRKFGL